MTTNASLAVDAREKKATAKRWRNWWHSEAPTPWTNNTRKGPGDWSGDKLYEHFADAMQDGHDQVNQNPIWSAAHMVRYLGAYPENERPT